MTSHDALALLAARPSAAIPTADLAAILSLSAADAAVLAAALVSRGDLLEWDHPDGPAYILSGAAAAALGVEFVQAWSTRLELASGQPRDQPGFAKPARSGTVSSLSRETA